MKNGILIACLFVLNFSSMAQEKTSDKDYLKGKNEIRLNIAMSIAGLPELSYERFLEDNIGVGFSAAAAIDKPENISLRSVFMPYGRMYFGKKQNAGFFIEANLALAGQRDRYTDYYYDTSGMFITKTVDVNSVNFGIGAAVGVKLMTRNGYVGEIYAGGGRFFGNTTISNGFPRVGVSIGKRF